MTNERCSYGLLFKQLSIAFENNLQHEAARYDLTPAQASILIYLAAVDHPVNQREVEYYFKLSNPTVTGLMKRMESKGFITRAANPEDGRSKCIQLTPKALEVSSSVRTNLSALERSMMQDLTPEEEEIFHDLMVRVLKRICICRKEKCGESCENNSSGEE